MDHKGDMLYMDDGELYRRLPFGKEGGNWGETCHDCGAGKGEYHVLGCDVEHCPQCRRQLISCGHSSYAMYEGLAPERARRFPMKGGKK